MGFMSFVLGLAQPTVTPVVQVAKPHGEITVADVLINIVSLIGVLGVLIIGIGLLTGGLFILYRRWRDAHSDDAPLAEYTQLRLSTGGPDTPTSPTSTPRS
jgi:hypothetical protein